MIQIIMMMLVCMIAMQDVCNTVEVSTLTEEKVMRENTLNKKSSSPSSTKKAAAQERHYHGFRSWEQRDAKKNGNQKG